MSESKEKTKSQLRKLRRIRRRRITKKQLRWLSKKIMRTYLARLGLDPAGMLLEIMLEAELYQKHNEKKRKKTK